MLLHEIEVRSLIHATPKFDIFRLVPNSVHYPVYIHAYTYIYIHTCIIFFNIYIYILSCWNARGPENDQKHGCEGAREELRGSPKRTAEAKTLQKLGFRAVSKSVEKSVVSPFWLAGHLKNRRKRRFSIRFGLPRSSSFCAFFQVLAVRSRSKNRENASFLRVSRLVAFLGRPFFAKKKGVRRSAKKIWIKKMVCN